MKRRLMLAAILASLLGTAAFTWKYFAERRPILTVGVFREDTSSDGRSDLTDWVSDARVSLGTDESPARYGSGRTGVLGKAVFDFPGVERVRVTAEGEGYATYSEWSEAIRPGDVLMIPLRSQAAGAPGEVAIRRRKVARRSRPTLNNVGYPFMVPGTQPYDLAAEISASATGDGGLRLVVGFSNRGPGELTRVNSVALARVDEATGASERLPPTGFVDLPAVRLDEVLEMELVDRDVPDGAYLYRLVFEREHGDTDNANHDPRLKVRWQGGTPSVG